VNVWGVLLLDLFGGCFFVAFFVADVGPLLVRLLDLFLRGAGSGFGFAGGVWQEVRRPIQNSISRAASPVMNRFCHPSSVRSENDDAGRSTAVECAVARNA
jgi:hypothetical protein